MYYPYFRAKQYELKAIKEFFAEHSEQRYIVPILEPVKQQTNALNLAITEMLNNATSIKFALILNPHDGDFKHPTVHFDAWHQNNTLSQNRDYWIPAFLYSKLHASEIDQMIKQHSLKNVMIIFQTCMDIDDTNAWQIINSPNVNYVVNFFGYNLSRRLKTKLKQTGKQIIRLDDCFNSRIRNADYALQVDELFSEIPFFYKEDQLDGYSDYTTLPSEYVEGGMMPYALAIHLSYKKNEEQLYVHHFVSDSNETNSDIHGKFKEAASKVAPFFNDKYQTKAVKEIIEKANDRDGYPGLGYLKKLSIKNHLELILSL
ncbi:sce7725 family protein [Millionella massiliensis]|uniref:sce7725 family protein n=1 Tax=Millionella massiliensis TaxID=1871023 RepID=UPI0008DAC885|nr:sce7725 family protein [Millionella massiliensis]